ncbi:A-kinase anchor protein 13 isoform X3 [Hoplias malabaricus]|uniref:A-kinase anchor protein 13 isoform X3 n=1 Tax=Hoplias malabaricus TaxID=27720 RepID=UPI003461FD9F
MKLNPQQAPLYGECVLTVQLSEEECVEDEEDVEFYLLFAGTTQRHLTTTLRVSHVTLQAVCPAHDCGETVCVTLCQARPSGSVDAVAEDRFQYVQDLALDMAQFLLSASGQQDGLERALLLDECQIPLQECERLDETLALALRHIPLPPGWSVLGTDINNHANTDPGPHETLLHFAARRGLRKVALFLLQQPGGQDALRHQNKHGHTPAGVAQKKGHLQLQNLLSDLENLPCFESKAAKRRSPGGRAFLHHPVLNTYTLTVDGETVDASPPDLRADVEELQRFIQSHQQEQGNSPIEQQPISLILSRGFEDSSQKPLVTSCPGASLLNVPERTEEGDTVAQRENGQLLNGARDYIQSEQRNGSAGEDCGNSAGEGREECVVAVCAGVSCVEQQQEETDREVGVITEEQKEHFSRKTHSGAQSGNPREAAMGQAQGLLPSETQPSKENKIRWDLPKEKEGESLSGQEAAGLSTPLRDVEGEAWRNGGKQTEAGIQQETPSLNTEKLSRTVQFRTEELTEANSLSLGTDLPLICQETPSLSTEKLHTVEDSGEAKAEGSCEEAEPGSLHFCAHLERDSEPNASESSEETVVCSEAGDDSAYRPRKDTGNRSAKTEAEQDSGLRGSEGDGIVGLISLRPNMAPGPIHNIRREHSPLPQCQKMEDTVADGTDNAVDSDQHQDINQTSTSPAETVSESSELGRSCVSAREPTDQPSPPHGGEGGHGLVPEAAAAVASRAEQAPTDAPLSELKDGSSEDSSSGVEAPRVDDHPMTDLLPVDTRNATEATSPSDFTVVEEASPEASGGEPLSEGGKAEAGTALTFQEREETASPPEPGVGEPSSKGGEDALPVDLTVVGEGLSGVGEDGSPPDEAGAEKPLSKEDGGASLSCDAEIQGNLLRDSEVGTPPVGVEVGANSREGKASDEARAGDTLPKSSEDASSSVEADIQTNLSRKHEEGPSPVEAGVEALPKGSAGVGETTAKGGEDAPAVDLIVVGETLPGGGGDGPPADDAAVGPTLTKEKESASLSGSDVAPLSVDTDIQETSSKDGEVCSPPDNPGADEPLSIDGKNESCSFDAVIEGTLSDEGKEVSPPVEAGVGEPSPKASQDAAPPVEAVVGETLSNRVPDESSSNDADVQANLSQEGEEGSPSFEEGVGEVLSKEDEDSSAPDEPEVGETSARGCEGLGVTESSPERNEDASEALTEERRETTQVVNTADSTQDPDKPQHSKNELLALDQTCMVAPQPTEPASRPEEGSGVSSEATKTVAGSSDPATESSENLQDCVKINEKSSDMVSQESDGVSTSPRASTCKETSSEPSLGPPPEVSTSEHEGRAPISPLPDISGSVAETSSDSGFPLDNTCTSDTLNSSTQPVELSSPLDTDSGTVLSLDSSSPVEVDSSLSHNLPPSDTGGSLEGLCGSEGLEEEGDQRGEHRREREKPQKEHTAVDDPSTEDDKETSVTDMDQPGIHREAEVFYPLGSCADAEELKEPSSVQDASAGGSSEGGCRSVSVSSFPESEWVSDGDSLLSTETADDSVFKQSEDTVTLAADSTSGVSATGSSSTDDSSSLGPCGSELQPVEGALLGGSDQPLEGGVKVVSNRPGAETLSTTREHEEEEKKDHLAEVPERSEILRSSTRSLSPSRRHSWGPSRNSTGETEMGPRSVVPSEDGGKPAGHRRSMSWCPSEVLRPENDEINTRSYSLEGLVEGDVGQCSISRGPESQRDSGRSGEEGGSLVSLTEEELESNIGDASSVDSQISLQSGRCVPPPPLTLTKSVSLCAISPRDLDVIGRARPKRRISFSFSVSPILPKSKTLFAMGSSSSEDEEAANLGSLGVSGSLEYSISEEDPAPLRSDGCEVRVGGTKVSRTFSYLRSKMTKKSKEKDKEKSKDGKEKRSSSGHLFSLVSTAPPSPCLQCSKPFNTKDALQCTNCNVHVHKSCREGLPPCAKVKMKPQQSVTDSASAPGVAIRSKSVIVRERPWSTMLIPDDPMPPPPIPPPRKSPGIMAFNSSPLSKSISISNIAGQMDDAPLKGQKFLSQSTDSLHKISRVNESTESLTDEGAELMDGQLMGDFEADAKELEADSWSLTVDRKYLKQLKKDVIKRQDVIYELIQTEMHHVRTLRIMAEVYCKGLQKEVQLEASVMDKMFPMVDELLDLHTLFLTQLLDRRRVAQADREGEGGYIIRRIGDVLLDQFTGSNAERMTKVYGKFCSRHNETVNLYKELHAKDKRFQAFIRKMMSSPVVRRLSIPECVLLVTQRLTKYPVLLQRVLQHTKDAEEEHVEMAEALQQVKEVIAAVDLKVSEYEKRRRLKEIHSRTDSKSIMRMKSGQMFAREDLIRGRRLLHDGPVQLKTSAGRLKDVQALLLSDVFVFLQEKDQKYVFASLDQRSTVISLHKLIVREVANEERGLFLITVGMEKPEMVEVYASSKVERNTWIQLIQNAMQSVEKEDDEGVPSENEEDKRLQEVKAKEIRELLQKKDEQVVCLLEEKVRLFRELCDSVSPEDATLRSRMMFRATTDEVTKGEPIIRDALTEVEKLQELVNSSVCGAMGQQVCVGSEGVCAGSVSLPRRAETFGGFDSHQMNSSKGRDGEREEADESADLRRTESDSVLKKGGNANLLLLLKRNSEVLQSVTRLHDLLNTLQAVVVQQDTFVEDQRQALSERPSRHPSISSSSSSSSSRPASLIEQEKQRSAERQRQEAEERRRREKEWEQREKDVQQREERLNALEEENERRRRELEEEKNDFQTKKEEYQRDLARLKDSQRKLEREREQLYTQIQLRQSAEDLLQQRPRTSSSASEDSLKMQSFPDPADCMELSSSPSAHDLLTRVDSKRKGKNLTLNPFSSSSGQKSGAVEQSQIPSRLLQLAKPKEKKEKKKKKGKGQQSQNTEAQESSVEGSVFFC